MRQTIIEATEDAFGRALLDHLEGREDGPLILEVDDGSSRPADLQPADFFLPAERWPSWEQHVIGRATGSVLDLGAGAGRHSLHLQQRGHRVTAVDVSPGAVDVCRARGIRDVRAVDLRDPAATDAEEPWGTVLLMCGNLGLAGDWEPTRDLLTHLAGATAPGALLIGDSVDPTSDDPDDLAYEARNLGSGFHRGHVRLRLRYRELETPWWDLINVPPSEIERLIEGTGWTLEERLGDDEGYAVVLRRRS